LGLCGLCSQADPYLVACLALNEAVLFYGCRRVSQFQQKSALEDSQALQQPNAPETSPLDDRALLFALLRGLYVIAVAGIYLLLHANNLTISLWDYTSEPKGSAMMFRLSGYMLGGVGYISIALPYLDTLYRLSPRRERWHSAGQFSALTMLGVAIGGLVSLYLP
jgi:hypothetical protein